MMREAVEKFDQGIKVENYYKTTNRTCDLLLGIGDGKFQDVYIFVIELKL